MMIQLRGSGSTKIVSRLPPPGWRGGQVPVQHNMPSRIVNRPIIKSSLAPSPSTHVFFNAGPPPQSSAYKHHPYAAQLTAQAPLFKFSSPGSKTAIKFQSAPPLRSKPEYIYEKVNAPKFPDPVQLPGSDAAIHTIPAPNLSNGRPIPELSNQNSFEDFSKLSTSFGTPQHFRQYQVNENNNDQKSLYAPDNDPSLRTTQLLPVDNPIDQPSDGKPKPVDVLYHQSLDFGASPLIQPQLYPISQFPVTAQPQLQQYHYQQNAMLQQGMPLASLNPTYLVMQSNNLLNQHQQHLTSNLFRPENGFIDTSNTAQPGAVFNSFDYTKPQQVASIGQIYSAQQDQLHQLEEFSTNSPSTLAGYYDADSSDDSVAYAQLLDPKPSNYQYSNNFIDIDDHQQSTQQKGHHNLLNYNDLYQNYVNHRQLTNELILREAQEKLEEKLHAQQQQEQTAFDLHQLVTAEKYNPLRIVVPDEVGSCNMS